jgi:hypothetical protein
MADVTVVTCEGSNTPTVELLIVIAVRVSEVLLPLSLTLVVGGAVELELPVLVPSSLALVVGEAVVLEFCAKTSEV